MPDNRYTADKSPEETQNEIDYEKTLLDIMQEEYPEDPVFNSGNLNNELSPAAQIQPDPTNIVPTEKDMIINKRSSNGVVQIDESLKGYTKYNLVRSVPTISEDELDELLDDEWDQFDDEEDEGDDNLNDLPLLTNPAADGLFLVNVEISMGDYHDLYLSAGPQNLYAGADIADVFCVFYIDKGTAMPVPNYQTLEVMLVERGLTYGNITEATAEEIKDYDLLLDGKYLDQETEEANEDASPIEEFSFRSLPDRSAEWNVIVRFKSGYRPQEPFKRDPGDYVKPFGIGGTVTGVDEEGNMAAQATSDDESSIFAEPELASGLGVSFNERANLPPEQKYASMAFQNQTYEEQLREKYEGKMIITAWPKPYKEATVENDSDEIIYDDLVFNLRMMTLGYWKQVTETAVIKKYCYINEFDISEYDEEDNEKDSDGAYGEIGLINLLIENGGIINVPQVNGDIDEETEPLWNAFSHIIEVDRLDTIEFDEFINDYNNGGNPFDIEYLAPYEPPGSVTYYNQARYLELARQAALQAEFTAIKNQIIEIWPNIYAEAMQLKTIFDSTPYDDIQKWIDYQLLRGAGSPLFKIFRSRDGKWKYKKKKRKKNKTKEENLYLPRLLKKTHRIRSNFTREERKNISRKFDWGPDGWSYPDWQKFDKEGDYFDKVEERIEVEYADFTERADQTSIDDLRAQLEDWFTKMGDMDNDILVADELEEIQAVLDDVLTLQQLIIDYKIAEEESYMAQKILKADVEEFRNKMLKQQYKAVQYIRKKVHYKVGNRKKFSIKWPSGPKNILNKYISGLNFSNYQK